MKPIVSFDVDMTLLDHKDWTIPDSAMKTIEELRKNYTIVLATGRDMDSRLSRGICDQIAPDAIIHLNGTKITVGDQLIYEHIFDRELLTELLEFVNGTPYSIGASIGSWDFYIHPQVVKDHDIRLWGECGRQFEDPGLLLQQTVRTLAYIGDEAGAKQLEEHFPQLNIHMFPEMRGADVVEKCASKAEGLYRLCQYLGVPVSETTAFGDSMNDLEIIKVAGRGIAMGNAMEELKQAADYVTNPIGEDGVRNACLHFGMID